METVLRSLEKCYCQDAVWSGSTALSGRWVGTGGAPIPGQGPEFRQLHPAFERGMESASLRAPQKPFSSELQVLPHLLKNSVLAAWGSDDKEESVSLQGQVWAGPVHPGLKVKH
ncbi:unnamed protein product [Boreogadus saida]